MKEFSGRNFIVTGASSGIGQAVCVALDQCGANIALIGRSMPRLEKTTALLSSGQHTCHEADLTQIDTLKSLTDSILTKYEQVDGFIHCAGVAVRMRLGKIDYSLMHTVMSVNYYAFMEMTRCLLEKKKKIQPFTIVALSSLASAGSFKHLAAYSASKSALNAAIRCLGVELIPKNVRVNAVAPAYVDTPMNAVADELDSQIRENNYQPLGLLQASEVADLVLYLLSEKAKSITGAVFPINGGAAC